MAHVQQILRLLGHTSHHRLYMLSLSRFANGIVLQQFLVVCAFSLLLLFRYDMLLSGSASFQSWVPRFTWITIFAIPTKLSCIDDN